MDRLIQLLMYRLRWLLAPIYLGLGIALLALGIKFYIEAYHMIIHIFDKTESDIILSILSLIDMAMVGGLIVMVMMSGYENFVSQINVSEKEEKLSWLGKLDASSLKMKVAASIVAISSIHLLKMFMNAQNLSNQALTWYVIIHITFVVSAFAMGYLDKITKQQDGS